ncbi:MAG TPA: hypothetical protein VGR06_37485 [Actinophytocola sp.]|uniref:hypothetical protein n=1 Tax=Actinophytocola sp. TaxID=1872138 RepID=UPI002E07A854|nr:hypothetical protein [Actinophytocola sp.]
MDVEAVAAKTDELDPDQTTDATLVESAACKFLEFMREPEPEPKGELSKTLLMLRRVIRDRPQRRHGCFKIT